jgi:AraC-like DNA-binding protein
MREPKLPPTHSIEAATGIHIKRFQINPNCAAFLGEGMRLTEFQHTTSTNNRLFWSTGDTGIVDIEGTPYQLSDGIAVFSRHGETASVTKPSTSNTKGIVLVWHAEKPIPPGRHIFTAIDPVFHYLIQLRECLINQRTDPAELTNKITQHLAKSSEPPLTPAIDSINANFSQPISTRDLTRSISLSESQIRRIFIQSQGMPPRDYILKCRIANAQHLLKTTSLPLQTVAAKSGFSSFPTFSRVFKRETGQSPKNARIR